jgi:hypothetical protein
MARDTSITDLDLSGTPPERIHSDGRRRLKLTAQERKDIRHKRLIDKAVTLFLDIEEGYTRDQMCEILRISPSKLKDITKEEYFVERYNQRLLDIANDPVAAASQAAIVEALPKATRALLELLEASSETVRLRAVETIFKQAGIKPPDTAVGERSELTEFLRNANVNVEQLNIVPAEFLEAAKKHNPGKHVEELVEGEYEEVIPTQEMGEEE